MGEWLRDSWAVPKPERVVEEAGESRGGEFRRAGAKRPISESWHLQRFKKKRERNQE